MDEPEARLVESDDEPISLPSVGRSWMIAVGLLWIFGGVTFWLLAMGVASLPVAGFVCLACFVAPMVPGLLGELTLDRAVPFGGALAALAIVYFWICIDFGSDGDFFPMQRSKLGALLYLLTFAAVPFATITGALAGCALDKLRRGRPRDGDELLL